MKLRLAKSDFKEWEIAGDENAENGAVEDINLPCHLSIESGLSSGPLLRGRIMLRLRRNERSICGFHFHFRPRAARYFYRLPLLSSGALPATSFLCHFSQIRSGVPCRGFFASKTFHTAGIAPKDPVPLSEPAPLDGTVPEGMALPPEVIVPLGPPVRLDEPLPLDCPEPVPLNELVPLDAAPEVIVPLGPPVRPEHLH